MLRKMTKKRNELLLNSIQNLVTNSPFISSIMFLKSEQFVGTSYEKLIEMDFSAKAKKDSVWSKEDLQLLKKACEDIYSGKIIPHVKSHAYYISHYIFHGTKSKSEVEGAINRRIRSICDHEDEKKEK